jgi:hypothetical protein
MGFNSGFKGLKYSVVSQSGNIQGAPLAIEAGIFDNFSTNKDIATKCEADLHHCVRNVKEKNVLLFKFRFNIVIGVRII